MITFERIESDIWEMRNSDGTPALIWVINKSIGQQDNYWYVSGFPDKYHKTFEDAKAYAIQLLVEEKLCQ